MLKEVVELPYLSHVEPEPDSYRYAWSAFEFQYVRLFLLLLLGRKCVLDGRFFPFLSKPLVCERPQFHFG